MTRAIAGLALLGLAISIYLTWVHYAGIEPVCTGISDCERVQSSDYAELAGHPGRGDRDRGLRRDPRLARAARRR